MKRLLYVAVTVLACAAAWQAVAMVRKANPAQELDMKADMTTLLRYKPTDGESHTGKVRRAVYPVEAQL